MVTGPIIFSIPAPKNPPGVDKYLPKLSESERPSGKSKNHWGVCTQATLGSRKYPKVCSRMVENGRVSASQMTIKSFLLRIKIEVNGNNR